MPIVHFTLVAFATCDKKFCLYAAFGLFLLARALLNANDRRYDAAREDTVVGLLHVLLSLW